MTRCVSVTSWYCVETARLIELVFGTIEFYTVVVVVVVIIIIIIISTPIILTLSFQASFNPPSLQILPTVAFLFYRAMLCIRGTSRVGLCPSVSVSVSVTSRSSTKTAKRRITQTTPHDSPGTLVF